MLILFIRFLFKKVTIISYYKNKTLREFIGLMFAILVIISATLGTDYRLIS